MKISSITPEQIVASYDAILLDAFGVLVYQHHAMPGAQEFIERLNREGKPYYILTNDAAHSISNAEKRFQKLGLNIREDRIITAGSLLIPYFEENHLKGHGCVVMGTQDSRGYVEEAGGVVVAVDEDRNWDVLVVCDEMGYPFLENLDMVLSMLFHKLDRGERVKLLLPNPDKIYRKNEHYFGITAGSIALVLEAALRLRYPGREDLSFFCLGKPYLPIFEEAYRRSGTRNMVMVGDQLAYDIRGAKAFGIDAVLMGTGIANLDTLNAAVPECPDYLLSSW